MSNMIDHLKKLIDPDGDFFVEESPAETLVQMLEDMNVGVHVTVHIQGVKAFEFIQKGNPGKNAATISINKPAGVTHKEVIKGAASIVSILMDNVVFTVSEDGYVEPDHG